MTRRSFLASAAATASLQAAAPGSGLGIVIHSFGAYSPKSALEFLELCHSIGAGGIQTSIRPNEPADLKRLRDQAGEYGMYIEASVRLPRTEDTSAFERSVRDAKQVGALAIRSVCLGGRRYETFSTLDEWKEFVAGSKAAVARAVKIVEKHKIPLAIENHKDWTQEEHIALLKEYESEYLGATLDTGNNMSLLDDGMDFARALAPYAFSTHLKDMAVEEYEDGFLLAEVPLGEGILDMKAIRDMVRAKRPKTRFSLEMITRDPLQIPCLTEKYWATFPNRSGRYLARALATAKARGRSIPRVTGLDKEARKRFELDNVKQCLHYARTQMAL